MENRVIHVAIIEDDDEIRNSLAYIINASPGFYCKHTYVDGESAVKELPNVYVNVVLTDIELPSITGITAIRRLKPVLSDVDFIMLTVREDNEALFDSLCAGATGFLVKDTPPHLILKSIREVFDGGAPITASLARKVVSSFQSQPSKSPLSTRETEILGLLCKGMNYKAIAVELYLSGHTVKTHTKNIYRKLEVNTRAQAVSRAIKEDLV